ncbi:MULTISPECIES: sulfate/molybdate ABC transporter ATP-binding protein [Mycobacteriaceae]|uniref:Molybdenum ABC transporter ATP-binding protein n=1 Tax=Mycolicibacterium neoaurum VKM Ac-1815D TaxID=700508 RepID=V5X8I0_MYCNE|nr:MULTISPECIES: ATP-binding cassette domain-containing protein [Mycobacteriaceae]AHC24760.1 molybdenum ABC transporter ATP-binding protein [Mycolicibacterium neoaurum VKM Ac-1815D]AMO05309.1 molybdenum ABC transporter ATP-binding protein [Mycolicibacterium neoaurum]AXK76376.1 ATP-binding cassette domain-containing protein [Mycolicibacterium neoaurum]KJQ50840.1 molybdenum ABC transporter ATP-binding protein [Mycolicibacterium neoaurum]KUM10039.1 molybdenum ABC transporter ATP-binding protein [
MSAVRVTAGQRRRGIEFDVSLADGKVLAVLGPNGAGKSTLLLMITGLLRPDSGRIELGDTVLTDTAAGIFVPPHARGIAMLSQQAMLFPHMTAEANVAYAPRCRGLSRSAAREQARHWLTAVDAMELAARRPAELSGGQAQRIAVARALAAEPRLLLLDEPMAALDVTAAPAMRRLLREVLRETGRTAIIVTHDLLDALALADTVVVIDDGHVVESGNVRQVLSEPRSDFAARIAGVNLVSGVLSEPGILRTAWGQTISGLGDLEVGSAGVALFRPAAVAVHLSAPHASPRNIVQVQIAELDIHGCTVRVRGAEQPDGGTGLAADITPAAAAELDLEVGQRVYFVMKTQEVQLHPALVPMM